MSFMRSYPNIPIDGGDTAAWPSASLGQEDAVKRRVRVVSLILLVGFFLVSARLVDLALLRGDDNVLSMVVSAPSRARADILDRNGIVVASDLQFPSLYVEPHQIVDVGDTIDQLLIVMPGLTRNDLLEELTSESDFRWLKRLITPGDKARIHNLGLPGINFRNETGRVYPMGRTLSQVIGHVNIDNVGQAGIERYLDTRTRTPRGQMSGDVVVKPSPVTLALDVRVAHALRDELELAMEKFSAKAAAAVVLDADTGEVIGLSSLPDYEPTNPEESHREDRINRISKGLFELGSTFKIFTIAMALDEGVATLDSRYDARKPFKVFGEKIKDHHAQNKILSVPEIFIHSSNIGAAKIAIDAGMETQRSFLRRIGMLDRVMTEIPETGKPRIPDPWKPISTVTISYGYGLSVTLLHAASAAAAMVNGGYFNSPTFFKRSRAEAKIYAKRVLKAETSLKMRYLMRLNVQQGTAKRSAVPGYRVGGKTGTAEKWVSGRYDSNRNRNTFIAAFPIDDPRYIVVALLDEPKGIAETHGFSASGFNVAPTVAGIINRIAPMLGVVPDQGLEDDDAEVLLAATN